MLFHHVLFGRMRQVVLHGKYEDQTCGNCSVFMEYAAVAAHGKSRRALSFVAPKTTPLAQEQSERKSTRDGRRRWTRSELDLSDLLATLHNKGLTLKDMQAQHFRVRTLSALYSQRWLLSPASHMSRRTSWTSHDIENFKALRRLGTPLQRLHAEHFSHHTLRSCETLLACLIRRNELPSLKPANLYSEAELQTMIKLHWSGLTYDEILSGCLTIPHSVYVRNYIRKGSGRTGLHVNQASAEVRSKLMFLRRGLTRRFVRKNCWKYCPSAH
jgi:hypothetical protein